LLSAARRSQAWINIADVALGGNDMPIGIVFFLRHRIFVSNATRTLDIIY
jgi:hypothetical protein